MPRRSLSKPEREAVASIVNFLHAYIDASDSDRPMVLAAVEGSLARLKKALPVVMPVIVYSPAAESVCANAHVSGIPKEGGVAQSAIAEAVA